LELRNKIHNILTDVAHIAAGAVSGYLSLNYPVVSLIYTLLYLTYQLVEYITAGDDDIVSDLREYVIGFTAGIVASFYI